MGERLRQTGLVVAGGMIGSMLRFLAAQDPGDVPWEVLGINLVGAVAAGWLVGRISHHSHRARWLVPFAVVGVTGALTTFSGLVVDVLSLVDAERWGETAIYAGASLLCGPVAAASGLHLGGRE